MSSIGLAPELRLPWDVTAQDDRRFLKMLLSTMIALGALFVIVPQLSISDQATGQTQEASPLLAQIIMEEKTLPEPVKPPPKPVRKDPPPPDPIEKVEAVPPEPTPQINPLEEARTKAAVSGLLAFQDDLSEMRESVDISTLNKAQMRRGQERAAITERSIVTSGIAVDSGGIKTSKLSRNAGGAALSGRETTSVKSSIAGAENVPGDGPSTSPRARSDQSIRRVMDNNRSAVFALYNRALRKNPLLRGKVTFEMSIDSSGEVIHLDLVSSELDDSILIQKILSRIRLINFGAEKVETTVVSYSLDFLPYT